MIYTNYIIISIGGKPMSKKLSFNLNAVEIMHFYWLSVASREKLNEKFITDIASSKAFQLTFNESFTKESVRRCLSAISNREPFTGNPVESRFYSRNLMILEYYDTLEEKINGFKALSLSNFSNDTIECFEKSNLNELEIIVVPNPFDTMIKTDNKLIINFFKFNMIDGTLSSEGKSIEQWIVEGINL